MGKSYQEMIELLDCNQTRIWRNLYLTKIKEQTRKLVPGSSKYYFEVADKTDQVSSKHRFEVADKKVGQKVFKISYQVFKNLDKMPFIVY